MTKIQADRLRKGIEALRSGAYKQGRGSLSDGENHCCLGVLCDVYHKETGKGRWRNTKDGVYGDVREFRVTAKHRSTAALPKPVQDYYGLESEDPHIQCSQNSIHEFASHLNDTKRYSFKKIAKGFENLIKELIKE